jgi:hypothetical protein
VYSLPNRSFINDVEWLAVDPGKVGVEQDIRIESLSLTAICQICSSSTYWVAHRSSTYLVDSVGDLFMEIPLTAEDVFKESSRVGVGRDIGVGVASPFPL